MSISIDSSVLLGYYQSRSGSLSTSTPGKTASAAVKLPTAPWDSSSTAPRSSDLVRSVLLGKKFVDPAAAKLDVPGASDDYRNLFALYQGLNALNGLAERAGTKGVGQFEMADLTSAFAAGMSQVTSYLGSLKLDQLRLAQGDSLTKDRTEVGVARDSGDYVTGPLYTGQINDPAPAFDGEVKFNISVKRGTVTHDIAVDLSDMGSIPRSMPNVVSFLNDKLKAEGLTTRFAVDRIEAQPRTVTVGGKTVTLPAVADSYALQIKGDTTEALTLSAPSTAGAVYLTQSVGKDADVQSQLLKFQTDQSTSVTPPPAPYAAPGSAYAVDGRTLAKTLGVEMADVRQSVKGPDGSLYVLANVNGAAGGQAIKGSQDVALVKYDSAGNVVFTRTLGAQTSATGTALAVAADGKVAIVGSVTGAMDGGDAGVDAAKTDSFVTVLDPHGQELWTQRRAAREDDTATAVAFADDGTVYVAGQTKSAMPGAASVGGQDGYLQGFSWNGKSGDLSRVTSTVNKQFGTTGADTVSGITIEGSEIVTAGVESGHAVLRRFDVAAGGVVSDGAVRDLGDLMGGSLEGVSLKGGQVIVAGTTGNGALSAGAVTTAFGGGKDAFVAKLDGALNASSGDRLTYLGGSKDSATTAFTVADGKVWLAGTVTADMPGTTALGDQDGFLSRIDPDTGAVEYSRRFTGLDRTAAPTSITVDPTGSSVLDRLGLPTGTIQSSDSKLLTANSAVRAGDQFQIKTSEGGASATVTITADDTLQSLATKISRASGYTVSATVVIDGDQSKLQIKPSSDRKTVEFLPGKTGRDALEALGLSAGVVRNPLTGSAAASAEKIYGLKFDSGLNLGSAAAIKAAQDNIQAAMTVIRSAYRDLKTAAQPQTSAAAKGPVPAYLSAQIANYQAALDRLTSGS